MRIYEHDCTTLQLFNDFYLSVLCSSSAHIIERSFGKALWQAMAVQNWVGCVGEGATAFEDGVLDCWRVVTDISK